MPQKGEKPLFANPVNEKGGAPGPRPCDGARSTPTLEVGLGQAVGAALRPVLRAPTGQGTPRLIPVGRDRRQQALHPAHFNRSERGAAGYRQRYARSHARSTRCGLDSKCQENHKEGEYRRPRRLRGPRTQRPEWIRRNGPNATRPVPTAGPARPAPDLSPPGRPLHSAPVAHRHGLVPGH